ncbi:MAG TPA: hypothetical protein VEY08_07775, partial [Chloroflexia bacterium]|nr:hypothetical protein [Chloroflexia bacterium]
MAVVAPDDVWAVGEYYTGPGDAEKSSTLIMHWDGKEWSIVGSPSPADRLNSLLSIAAASAKDIWAVGLSGNISEPIQPLILHWDGVAWSQVATPTIPPPPQAAANSLETGQLLDVSVIRNDDVWAVGSGTGGRALALHWDGKTWSLVDTEAQGALQSVGGVAANDIWALGISQAGAQALHWDGSRWNKVPLPAPSAIITLLHGLAVLGRDDVWVAGYFYPAPNSPAQGLVMRWDGKEWVQQERPPVQALGMQLEAAAAVQGNLWVVGHAATGKGFQVVGLLARYTGAPCASPLPTHAVPLYPPAPLPGSNSRTFTETGYTVSGIFLDYWQRNGGLSQQGYPIFAVMGEVSPLNGSLYTVQYFERAVFEYHPENKPPYDVLLSQLGTFQYTKKYPGGAPGQKPNNDPGSVFFPETGKRLGGAFLEYWSANGGLPQQGYPLSDEFTEVSELNGRPYTVQYFERAVFEYHPENPKPFDVLLSHLGRFRYDEVYGSTSRPPSTPSPTAPAGTPGPGSRLIARNVLGKAAAYDRYLFWIANDRPTFSVYMYDRLEGHTKLVTNRPGFKHSLAADSTGVVWVEGNAGSPSSVRGYNAVHGREFTAVEPREAGAIGEDRMAFDNVMLYYAGSLGTTTGIIARNIASGEDKMLIEGGRNPYVWGDVMLWSREVPTCYPGEGNSRPPCTFEQELYVRKANQDSLLVKVPGGAHFSEYSVHSNRVVWVNPAPGMPGSVPYLFDINGRTQRQLSNEWVNNPLINGSMVLWATERAGAEGRTVRRFIEHYDLDTNTVSPLLESTAPMYPQALMGQKALAYLQGN